MPDGSLHVVWSSTAMAPSKGLEACEACHGTDLNQCSEVGTGVVDERGRTRECTASPGAIAWIGL